MTTNGVATSDQGQYHNTDGGTAIRMINPCDDQSCQWIQGETSYSTAAAQHGRYLQMTGRRWYPMVEELEEDRLSSSVGDKNGGYVNTAAQDNPTYEFFPPKGDGEAINLQFLSDTLPVNLYALTWLMPRASFSCRPTERPSCTTTRRRRRPTCPTCRTRPECVPRLGGHGHAASDTRQQLRGAGPFLRWLQPTPVG